MQSAEEKRLLLDRFDPEQASPVMTLLKCAAGILGLVIMAGGPWLVLTAGGPRSSDQAGGRYVPQAAPVMPASLAESKRVFDQRRWEHRAIGHGNAQAANTTSTSAPTEIE